MFQWPVPLFGRLEVNMLKLLPKYLTPYLGHLKFVAFGERWPLEVDLSMRLRNPGHP